MRVSESANLVMQQVVIDARDHAQRYVDLFVEKEGPASTEEALEVETCEEELVFATDLLDDARVAEGQQRKQ